MRTLMLTTTALAASLALAAVPAVASDGAPVDTEHIDAGNQRDSDATKLGADTDIDAHTYIADTEQATGSADATGLSNNVASPVDTELIAAGSISGQETSAG